MAVTPVRRAAGKQVVTIEGLSLIPEKIPIVEAVGAIVGPRTPKTHNWRKQAAASLKRLEH